MDTVLVGTQLKSEGEKQARRIWTSCLTADAEQLHMYWATVARTHVSLPCNHMHVTARTYARISYYRVFLDHHVAVRGIHSYQAQASPHMEVPTI